MLDNEAPTEVVSHCRYLLQHFPKNVAVYRLLGQALLQKAQNEVQPKLLDEAAEIFRRVLSAQPDDYVAHLGLGEIAQQRGALDEAVWHFERAAEQMPGNNVLHDTIRQLYEQRGMQGAAGERLPLTRVTLARQYLKANALDQALNEIRSVLEDAPDRLDLHMLEAEALWESGRWVEAGEVAAFVLRECPDCLSANRIMASLWLKYKRPTDAQPFLARLEALDPAVAARALKADGGGADAIALPRLDYTTKAAASLTSEMPEWVQDLDEPDQYVNPFEAPTAESQRTGTPAFHEEPPSAGVPDWAAVFAGMGAEPERDEVWTHPQDDSSAELPVDMWNAPYPPAQPLPPAPSSMPDVPDWFAGAPNGQSAPAEASFPADEWSGVEDYAPDEYEAEQDAGSEEMPEFDSFLQNISASRGGTSALDEPGAEKWAPIDSAATGDGGYALDWMNELDAPAAVGPVPEQDFLAPEPPAWDSPTAPGDTEVGDWLTGHTTEPDEESDAELSEGDWLSVLASRSSPAAEEAAPTGEPEEDVTLSAEDWIARLSTGQMEGQIGAESALAQIEAPDVPESAVDETLASEAAGSTSAPEEAPAARPAITEDELALLRRASTPPPDLDLNALFELGEQEAVPAEEIPAWLQSLEPDGAPAEAALYQAGDQAEERSGAAGVADLLYDATAGPSGEEMQAALEPEDQPGDVSEMSGWLADSTVDEAAEAEADLIGALGLSSAALPGTVELDAELLAFFESPEDAAPHSDRAQPGMAEVQDREEGRAWPEPSAVAEDDWLGSYITPEIAEPQPWEEPEAAPPTEAALAGWLPQSAGDSVDEGDAAIGLQPVQDEPDATDVATLAGAFALPVEPVEVPEAPGAVDDQVAGVGGEAVAEAAVDDAPDWLAGIEPDPVESPLLAGLDRLLNEPYDPFEGGREDQVPTYTAAKETGILQPNEQPDWMTAFLGGDEAETESPDAPPNGVADSSAAPDRQAGYAAIQSEGVLEPESEAGWLAALSDEEIAEPDAPVSAAFEAPPETSSEDALEAAGPEENDSTTAHGIYVPLPARQPKLNYMPDWLAAIASEGKKLDAELLKAVESEQQEHEEAGPLPVMAPSGKPEAANDDLYGQVDSGAWLGDSVAGQAADSDEAASPAAAPANVDLPPEVRAREPLPQADLADDASDLAFLEQLDQVDWLPDVREEPASEEEVAEDDLLADLDLRNMSDPQALPRDAAPEEAVAPAWDLPDTTSDLRARQDDYAPPDGFSFDDEVPAWLRGQGGHDQKSSSSRGLPEWLRSPDEDQH